MSTFLAALAVIFALIIGMLLFGGLLTLIHVAALGEAVFSDDPHNFSDPFFMHHYYL